MLSVLNGCLWEKLKVMWSASKEIPILNYPDQNNVKILYQETVLIVGCSSNASDGFRHVDKSKTSKVIRLKNKENFCEAFKDLLIFLLFLFCLCEMKNNYR